MGKTRISTCGRHFVGDQQTLDEFVDKIVPQTVEAAETRIKNYSAIHRLRVNIPFLGDNNQEHAKQLDSLRKEFEGLIDMNFMVGRGPGASFKDLFLQGEVDVTVLYGAEDMDIREIQHEVAGMADEMLFWDYPLGVGCRPQVKLHEVPEADVMRQIHEAYYAIAAGAGETLRPENPLDHDLSNGSSIFVGVDGVGGFGDITSGLSLFDHRSTMAQEVANYLSFITTISNPEDFTSEYGIHIHTGIEKIFRAYASYNENRFYESKTEFTDAERKAAMEKIDVFILKYNTQLAKIPGVYTSLKDSVSNPETKERILRNISSWDGFTKVATPEELVERVDRSMRKGLYIGTTEGYDVRGQEGDGEFSPVIAKAPSKEEAEYILAKTYSFRN